MGRGTRRTLVTLLAVLAASGLTAPARSSAADKDTPLSLPPSAPGLSLVAKAPWRLPNFVSVQAWAHGELLGFGSDERRTVMVGYRPATGHWRRLARPPFDEFVAGAQGVYLDGRLSVLGISCPTREDSDESLGCLPGSLVGAVYDVASNRWTEIEGPPGVRLTPGGSGFGAATGTLGHEAVFTIGDRSELWAFDPRRRTWRALPALPFRAQVCAAAGSLFAVGIAPQAEQANHFAELQPRRSHWTSHPAIGSADSGQPLTQSACSDSAVMVATPTLDEVRLYDVADRAWTIRAGVDDSIRLPVPSLLQWNGAQFFASYITTGVAYDELADTWQTIAPLIADWPFGKWLNGTGLFMGSSLDGDTGIVAYRPH